jgi:ribonuclease HII
MYELARRYVGYGWESNVGYSTREHCTALTALGATIHHRRSFAPVRLALAGGTFEPELLLMPAIDEPPEADRRVSTGLDG